MQTQISMNYDQILVLAINLSNDDKNRLIKDLSKNSYKNEERKFGKYEGQGWISDDFNKPLEEFEEYLK